MIEERIWTILGVALCSLLALWIYGEHGRLLRRSTWSMVRLSGMRRFLKLTTLHGYVYARWTNLYVKLGSQYIAPLLGKRGNRWLANHYHGKMLTTELAQAIITIDHEIPLRDLEQVVPYPMARDLVLHSPPDVAVFECPCRHMRANPCRPTQVCMVIGQPFVGFILEHHPTTSRQLTQQEAVDLLKAERERGHIHTAYFKDAAAGRFYAICNCCKCCCGGIEAMTKRGIPMISPSGYVAQIREDDCIGCGTCVETCPFDAISLLEDVAHIDWATCMGCGVCEHQCPNEAISLLRNEGKGVPLDVRLLAQP